MSPRRRERRLALVVSALALMVWAPAASSAGEAPTTGQTCPPPASPQAAAAPATSAPAAPAEPAPQEILVCVGSEAITGASFSHWLTVARNAEMAPIKGQAPPSAQESLNEVVSFLVSSDWVIGEARDLGVNVSTAQVRRTFDRIKGQQFPKQREFRAFLRSSGETVADLLFRVRLNLLTEQMQRHVVAGQRSAHSRQRALSRFVESFQAKWRSQTYCAPQYDVQDCGHVQSAL